MKNNIEKVNTVTRYLATFLVIYLRSTEYSASFLFAGLASFSVGSGRTVNGCVTAGFVVFDTAQNRFVLIRIVGLTIRIPASAPRYLAVKASTW